MRWLAFLLLLVNGVLFWWLSVSEESRVHPVQEGKLPRVSEIQLIDEQQPGLESTEMARERVTAPSSISAPQDLPEPREPTLATLEGSSTGPARVSCRGIGWFDSEGRASQYLQKVQAEYPGLEYAGLQERSEPLEAFHWVIIPPLSTRDQALELYRELVRAGIEAYVVPSGEHENAISLGLFRSKTSAEQILQQRQAENINATLVNFPRNRISYALVFRDPTGSDLSDIRRLVPESDAELQLIEFSDCAGVATAEKNP